MKVCSSSTARPKAQDGDEGQEQRSYRKPHTTTVFHISQTEPTADAEARWAARREQRPSRRDEMRV